MKDFFTIGEVARLFNIKIATLRYYDDIGLLKPQYINEQTHYRYYTTQQFERLNSIKYLRTLGMPIHKLLDFFNDRDIDNLMSMLHAEKLEIVRKKQELEKIEQKISRRLRQFEDAMTTPLDTIFPPGSGGALRGTADGCFGKSPPR